MFSLPINDSRIQSLTSEQIDFMVWSELIDNPERLKKLDNYYYDPDYDDYMDEVENEMINGIKRYITLENGEKIEYGGKLEPENIVSQDNNIGKNYASDEWEEV